ncbi:MAG: hypothetical protein WBQ43_24715 [Terriglobales bacterium]
MRRSSNPIRILGALLAAVLTLAVSGIAQVSGQRPHAPTMGIAATTPPTQEVPPCASTAPSPASGRAPSQVNPRAHSVTLSWKASLPRSSSKQDAIQGYNVYRSLKSNQYDRASKINTNPLPGTQCVDTTVEPRRTYFYVVKSVAGSENGPESGRSNQATAPIP